MKLFVPAAIAGALAAAVPAAGQPARLENARVSLQPEAGDLGRQVRGLAGDAGPLWIGWAAPAADGRHQMCCWESAGSWGDGDQWCCGRCRLERSSNVSGNRMDDRSDQPVRLEAPAEVLVLVRAESGTVGKVRVFSPDCAIDAGGLPVVWIGNVGADPSVAFLESLAMLPRPAPRGEGEGNVPNAAITAMTLIAMARRDASPHVRGQALFWLAQRAGRQAADTIENAILDDPDTEVKTRAVFALTQMPDGEGVTQLIHVARTNRNPEVRKKAIFWLGQSKDPRALSFFEEVLGK